MRNPPEHHKAIVHHLRDRFSSRGKVFAYRDNNGKLPMLIAEFDCEAGRFYSTIGICDRKLPIPSGVHELAAIGKPPWLPNAVASSIYYLRGRSFDEWPLVCEDVVKSNAKVPTGTWPTCLLGTSFMFLH
ncbi:MAG: hypothetical protein IPH08_11120 [Rhodocyclaceae bacterium]|nr:hypothetical protein [Rhodocyclaceae bacterium]